MTASIASWDFDVPREWFKIPLDDDLDARRWAGEFAHEVAQFLGAEGPVDHLVDGLVDVQGKLSRRRNPWLTAMVAVREESPLSIGALITAQLLDRDADGTPESLEQQMRRDSADMEPGSTAHDVVLWRDRVDAGDYVGMTQRIEHVEPGENGSYWSQRAIYVVFPPDTAEAVLFEFTTLDFGYFADIREDTELVVRTLRVERLDPSAPNAAPAKTRTPSPSQSRSQSVAVIVLLAVGILLALLAVASIVHLYLLAASGVELEGVYPFLWDGEIDAVVPAVLLLLAATPLFLGELLRRASWTAGYAGFWRGGSVHTVSRPLPVWALLAWLPLPVAAWAALILVPALGREDAFASAAEDFWEFTGLYGFVAAAIVGVMLMSLLKRAVFAHVARRELVAPERGRTFWRIASGGWRVESWCGGLATGLAGILPLVADDPVAVTVISIIAAVLAVLGVGFALGSWRTGEPIGYAESYA